ncbi:trypsin-like serine peptidase [Pseudonocardia acaciae]|uniref:trypsin-like serine peptidase n=1 Tax=Pseudonocardia acaciae TaxID=551276 RepID=UPI0012EDBAF8|nr:hypothetical protein [Pseudonocardia acaciae]
MERPIDHSTLAARASMAAEGRATSQEASVLEVALDEKAKPRLVRENGRVRLVADVGVNGLDVAHPYPDMKYTAVGRERAAEHLEVTELDGYRPAAVATTFQPQRAPETHRLRTLAEQAAGPEPTIFGTDDRVVFHDTNYPWRTVGKVRTAGGYGTGAVVGPRHVLTASHVINWSGGSAGWSTFTPGYYDGRGPWGEIGVSEVIFWEQVSGPLSDQQTAFDYVILITNQRIGDTVGFIGSRTYDAAWNGSAVWQYAGYAADLASGERPAYQGAGVVSSKQDFTLNGNSGCVLGHFNDFTPGQSGGSAWGWWGTETFPRVIGVGSTIGSTAVEQPGGGTSRDNEYGGGPALTSIISWARTNRP